MSLYNADLFQYAKNINTLQDFPDPTPRIQLSVRPFVRPYARLSPFLTCITHACIIDTCIIDTCFIRIATCIIDTGIIDT